MDIRESEAVAGDRVSHAAMRNMMATGLNFRAVLLAGCKKSVVFPFIPQNPDAQQRPFGLVRILFLAAWPISAGNLNPCRPN